MSKSYNSVLHSVISASENVHFWFRARRELVSSLIRRFIPHPKDKTFLEVGCGTGMMLTLFEKQGFQATGIDINAKALSYARKKTGATLIRKSFFSYMTTKQYDSIGLFDVLEHQKDDRKFLQLCQKVLNKNGILFLTVPAGMYLWNDIDIVSGHIRRYEKEDLLEKLTKAGFTVKYIHYWNILLLPWYILWRYIFVHTRKQKALYGYADNPSPLINYIGRRALFFEQQQFMFSVNFPFGTSLVVVATKN